MTTTTWYYALDDEPQGPVPTFDLLERIANRRLSRESLVWKDGMADWRPAHEIAELVSLLPPPLPGGPPDALHHPVREMPHSAPVISQPQDPVAATDSAPANETETHPWQRWFARVVDIYLFAFVLGIVVLFLGTGLPGNDFLLGLAILACWIPVEALALSNWGATPGKALMNIRVVRMDGSHLGGGEALGRAINVWISGLAFGIPIANLFTLVGSYNRLKKTGATTWDEGRYRIVHGNIGIWRALGVLGVMLLVIFALASR